MTSALRALTAEPWAIRPDYLHFMASLASLDRDGRADRRSAEGEDWFRLDLAAAAGPTAQRLEGARYAMLTREGMAIVPVVGPIFPRANLMTEMSGTGRFDKTGIAVREAATLTDLPAAVVTFEGPVRGRHEHEGGDLVVGWTVPGTYTVTVEAFPYLPAAFTLTVGALS
ncbi:MAG: hypothetical protein PGN25_05550 [Methylorubrum populi]